MMSIASTRPLVYISGTLLLCLALAYSSVATALIRGNETDRLALLAFKADITNDPSGVLRSWNESNHFCHWHGVICGRRHRRVIGLDLMDHKLEGSVSPHLGNMSFLRTLYLANNSFFHKIPQEIGRLHRLQDLWFDNNSISGEIPTNLSFCSSLISFYASSNKLTGKIPPELGSLSKLQDFVIYNNNLTGSIPLSFSNLSSLVWLIATSNNLVGRIPSALGQITNLVTILLANNRFSGTLPSTIFDLSSMTDLDVADNQLIHGSLPADMGITLPDLEFFGISGNQFTGSLPVSLSNASKLTYLGAGKNMLSGQVPNFERLNKLSVLSISMNRLGNGEANDLSFLSSLTNATGLEVLGINSNNFTGMLPESFSNLSTKLTHLYLDHNRIYGSIPKGIGRLINLEDIQLRFNQFMGYIPAEFGKLQKLKVFDFSSNKFSGAIPSSLGNLTFLIYLDVSANNLHGRIPLSLEKCQNLLALDLSRNKLSGIIPHQIFSLSSLSLHLDLSRNELTGSLPEEVGKLKNLGFLDVSGNILLGTIPGTLGTCQSLEILYMDTNHFQGVIPSSLSSLAGLQALDLSRNNLSGHLPQYLGGMKLQYLNLSFNNFEGSLPSEGIFRNGSAVSVNGNSKLCGGMPELHLPLCKPKRSKKRNSIATLKLTVSVVFGSLGLVLLLSLLLLGWLRNRRKSPASNLLEFSLLRLSYQSLVKATDRFSSTNILGVGSFGSVYRGILESGEIIAVKVLNLHEQSRANRSFMAECEILKNIRHRNLVKVLTACSSIDFQGNDFKAVVYEFMVNGSLEEWLHTEDEAHAVRHLNSVERLNIAIDVASALDYLHNHCQTPVVHCDIKPSNVLLDNEMTGHVGDFGIARFILGETVDIAANEASSNWFEGSVGYIPPEYGTGSKVSVYGDIYSFGILLLEMFTGKRPTNEVFMSDNLNLHEFSKKAFPERVGEIVDPLLEASISSTKNAEDCLISIFRIGIACSNASPIERMDISEVAAELHAIRDVLLSSGGAYGRGRTTISAQ